MTRRSGGAPRRGIPMLGSFVFLFIAPGTVAGLVPWRISRWHMQEPMLGIQATRWVGVALILCGAAVVIEAFARFAWDGLGTPAPLFPTRKLVVSGLYRHVRNPIYCAVTALILGEGLLLGDARVMRYGLYTWIFLHLLVMLYEEPTLRRRYGREYEDFRSAVPRWIPRLRAWQHGHGSRAHAATEHRA